MPSVLARFIYYMNFEFMRYTLIYVALCSRRLLMSKCLKLTKTIMLLGVTIKMFAAVTFILDSYHIWALIFFVMGNLSVHLSYSLRFSRGTANVDSDLKFCLMLAKSWQLSEVLHTYAIALPFQRMVSSTLVFLMWKTECDHFSLSISSSCCFYDL